MIGTEITYSCIFSLRRLYLRRSGLTKEMTARSCLVFASMPVVRPRV
jgi:hypothetical protein